MKTSLLSRSISPLTTKNSSTMKNYSSFYNRVNSSAKKVTALSKIRPDSELKSLQININNSKYSSFMVKDKVESVVSETETSENDEIKRIKKLFLIYTNNNKRMVSQKYLKLLIDARIIDGSFDVKKADILYAKETKHGIMDFNKFCDILVLIAQIKFPDTFSEDRNKCLNRLISLFLFPLLDKISLNNLEKTSLNNNNNINHLLMKLNDPEIKMIIQDNYTMFKVIYENYFPWEKLHIAYSQKKTLSEKAFSKFLEDFEICPNLISIKRGSEIFEEMYLKNTQIENIFIDFTKYNLGSSFTIFFLISAVFLIAIVSYDGIRFETEEKYRFFIILEKIFNSQALIKLSSFKNVNEFNEINSKFMRTASLFRSAQGNALDEFFTTINDNKAKTVPSQYITSLNTNENFDIINNNRHIKTDFTRESNLTGPQQNKTNPNEFKNVDDFDINSNFFSQHKSLLTRIFKFYCNLSNCTNYIFMNFSSFARLMSDCGVLEKIEKEYLVNVDFPFKLRVKSCNKNEKTIKRPSLNKYFGFSSINALFSKFSSEYDSKLDESVSKNLNNKLNYVYYTTSFNKFKIKEAGQDKTKVFSNKKINFNEFMKILICISHKIYQKSATSPTLNHHSQSPNKLKHKHTEDLTLIDPKKVTLYLDKFINEYLSDIYSQIEFIFESEEQDFTLLQELSSNEHIQYMVNRFRHVFEKIYEMYTTSKGYMFFQEFYKFCLEFRIFPDLLQKNRIYSLFVHFVEDFDQLMIKGNNNLNINVNQFISLIIFCAIDSKNMGEDTNDFNEKIILFFERMAVSQGIKNLTFYTGCGKLAADFNNLLNYFKSMTEKKPRIKSSNSFKEIYLKK